MSTCGRRTFVKQSAMLAGAAAAGRLGLPSAFARAAPQGHPRAGVTGRPELPFFKAQKGVDVIAHRGGKAQWPEETIYAFREAVNLGVDVLEMDVQLTRDGVLVLMHDPTVTRTTQRLGPVRLWEYGDPARPAWGKISGLDAGHDWPTDCKKLPPPEDPSSPHCRPAECDIKGAHPFRGKGIKVPRLVDVFEEFKASTGVRMVIEIKPWSFSAAQPFCDLLNRDFKELKDRVLVASFNDRLLRQVRENCAGVATSAGSCEALELYGAEWGGVLKLAAAWCRRLKRIENLIRHNPAPPAGFVKPPFDAIQVKATRIDKNFVDRAHSPDFNLKVHAWTVNDEARMQDMLDAGVDGIITDCPGLLLKVLNRAPK
jgi:glycerophosphoryl diester phosphodiesterase